MSWNSLGKDLPAAVVFVTAYDQYALKAFEAGALDYLLKPFDNARFDRALCRAKERIAHSRESPRKVDRLVIKGAGQVMFVKVPDIDWIEAADYYACLHVRAKSHLLRRRMSDLERELDPAVFCRIHRSTHRESQPDSRPRSRMKMASMKWCWTREPGWPLSRRYRKQLQLRMGIRSTKCP